MHGLPLMVAAHAVGRGLERLALLAGRPASACCNALLRDFKFGHRTDACRPSKRLRVLDHGGVAADFDVGEDGGDRALDGLVLRASKASSASSCVAKSASALFKTLDPDHRSTTRGDGVENRLQRSRLSLSAA
jgi:hypothetical protein